MLTKSYNQFSPFKTTYFSKGGQNKTILFKSASPCFDMWRNKAHECKGGQRGFAVIRLLMEQKRKKGKEIWGRGDEFIALWRSAYTGGDGRGVWKREREREREIRQVGL